MITTEGKTKLEVYTEILETLIKQGKRCGHTRQSISGVTQYNFQCAYGDKEGNHCAIGHLLPPEREDLMERGTGVLGLVSYSYLGTSLGPNEEFIRNNQDDLSILQDFHDLFSIYRIDVLGLPKELINQWLDLEPDNVRQGGS